MTTISARVAPRTAEPAHRGAHGALLFAVGTLVALIGSWNVSLWTDEAATVSAARRSTAQLWQLVHSIDAVHGTYYFLIHFWSGAFGYGPVALRLPSALAAGATVVGVWALARALGRCDVAVAAGIVAIVLPRITWMGIEARSFGPSAALAVWATVLVVVALRRGRWWWAGYAALAAAGIALNIYVALLLLGHAVTVLLLNRDRILGSWPFFVAAVGGVAVASPVVVTSLGQRGQLGDNAVGVATLVRSVVVNQWFLGATPTRVSTSSDGHSLWSLAAPVLALVGWALIVTAVVVAVRRSAPRGPLVVLLPWLVLPTALVAAYSLAVSPLYNPRYFTFCAPAVAVLIALGIGALRRSSLRIAALVLIVVLAAPIYVSQRIETGKSGTDWSSTAAYIAAHAKKGDGVYFAPLDAGTTTPVVERTTRNIAISYPSAFDGLVDATLTKTPAADDSLRGTSARLPATIGRLDGVRTLWVVRVSDYPSASSAADDVVLTRAGFHRAGERRGPMDDVIEYVR